MALLLLLALLLRLFLLLLRTLERFEAGDNTSNELLELLVLFFDDLTDFFGLDLTDEDIKDLLSFMKSLTSSLDKETFDRVMPEEVPSGIPIHRLKEETKYLLD